MGLDPPYSDWRSAKLICPLLGSAIFYPLDFNSFTSFLSSLIASTNSPTNLSYCTPRYPSFFSRTTSGNTCSTSWAINPVSSVLMNYPSSPPRYLMYSSEQSNLTPFNLDTLSSAFGILVIFSFSLLSDE